MRPPRDRRLGPAIVLGLALACVGDLRSLAQTDQVATRTANGRYMDAVPLVADVGWLYAQYLEFRVFPALDRAFQARADGRAQAAIAELEKIVADYDGLPRAHYALAVLYTEVDDPAAAEKAATAVLEPLPDFGPARLYRGLARLRLDQPADALADFDAAAKDPLLTGADRRFAQNMAIEASVAAGAFEQAWQRLDTLPDAESYRHLRLRGVVLDGLGRVAEAEQTFLRAVQAAPDSTAAAQALGFAAELARRDGRVADARRRLERALATAPDRVDLLLRLARLAHQQDQPDAVQRLVEQALGARPASGERRSLLTLLAETGRIDRAIDLTRRELAGLPGDARAALRGFLANLLLQDDDPSAAARQFEALGEGASDPAPLISAGMAYIQAGQADRAVAVLERASAVSDDPRIAVHLADAHLKAGAPALALQVLERADPSEQPPARAARLHYMRGLAHAAQDQPAAAVAAQREAVAAAPRTRLYRMAYGDALATAGRAGDAAEQFRAALAIADHPDARQRLAIALAEAGEVAEATRLLERVRDELPADSPRRFDVLERLGNLYASIDRYRESALAFLESIEPDDVATARKLLSSSISFAEAKAWDAGLDALNRARASLPPDSALYLEALERSAVVAVEAEKPQAAVAHYQGMLKHPMLPRSRRLDIYRRLAIVANAAGDDASAMDAYQAIADSPDATAAQQQQALENLGVAAERASAYARAIAAYRRLLGYDGLAPADRGELLRRVAVLAAVSNRPALAVQAYRELVGLPGAPIALRADAAKGLAVVAATPGTEIDGDSVIATLQSVLASRGIDRGRRLDLLAALSGLADTLGRNQLLVDTEKRRQALLDPGEPAWAESMERLASGYDRLARPAQTIEVMQTLLAHTRAPDDRRRYLTRIAVAAGQIGDHARAAAAFDALIALGATDWQTYAGLGRALRAAGDCPRAIAAFREARQRGGDATNLLYSGFCYDTLDKPGLAIAQLEAGLHAPDAALPLALRANILETLGFLFSQSQQHGRAADAWQRALAIAPRPDMQLRTARALRLSDRFTAARREHARVRAEQLPATLRPLYWDELSDLERADGDLGTALAALETAIALQRTPGRLFRRGLLIQELDDPEAAYADLTEAQAGAPESVDMRAALAYAEDRRKRTDVAIALLESVVAEEVDRLSVYEDLAYMNKRTYRNAEAQRWFRHVVANAPIYPVTSQAEADRLTRKQFAARRENQVLNNAWDVRAFNVLRSQGLAEELDPTQQSLLTSQGGLEVAHRLDWLDWPADDKPVGFRDGRTVHLFGRLNWGYETDTLELDGDSTIAGLGVRWKPFRQQSLFLSGERLIAVGDDARGDWLARMSYSWDRGIDIKPVADDWLFASGVLDAAYYLGPGDLAVLTAQGQIGWSFKLAPALVVTPNWAVAFQQQLPTDGRGSANAWETGPGVRARYWFGESPTEAYHAYADVGLHYMAGIDADDDVSHGLVLTLQLGF